MPYVVGSYWSAKVVLLFSSPSHPLTSHLSPAHLLTSHLSPLTTFSPPLTCSQVVLLFSSILFTFIFQRFRKALADAQELQTRRSLSQVMFHELRNPLNGTVGHLALAQVALRESDATSPAVAAPISFRWRWRRSCCGAVWRHGFLCLRWLIWQAKVSRKSASKLRSTMRRLGHFMNGSNSARSGVVRAIIAVIASWSMPWSCVVPCERAALPLCLPKAGA